MASPAVVVMAKAPVPGRVKTRLADRFGPETAAALHEAMLRCVLERCDAHLPPGPRYLALDDPDAPLSGEPAAWRRMAQGTGDLGDRIARVWEALGAGPCVFFGADSPDVPGGALAEIGKGLRGADAVVGPTRDGGYWTIGARALARPLLTGIDWGTGRVYHQTLAAAAEAGLNVTALSPWCDVDEPADVEALAERLASAHEPPLAALGSRISALCHGGHSG